MSLKSRMVVMTGGAGGIARATVPLLLADGADLLLIDPDGDGLQAIAAEADAGARLKTVTSAIDSPEACEAALAGLDRPIYGLVHLAGIFVVDDLDAAFRPVWNDVISANLSNAFDMAAA
ncbi:MAG: SDR family NAD(P)-dependent oxidoreductase, partial [Alphaproteobacteria bacterium]|nr:SDR family NAD(P)-dependent oxidoreductase [Alphaproteobacteria bacterium]